jgi:3',5'-cyclic AMP phosphodiesterase CpdA
MKRHIIFLTALILTLSRAANPFSMVVLGDRTADAREEIFEQILQEVKILKPDLLVNVGDLIEGYTEHRDTLEAQWDTIVKRLRATQVPYHLTPGNHDISDARSESVYVKDFGAPYYSFNYGNSHFVVIDNSRWDSSGALPADEMTWIDRDLAANRGARWTFVLMHRSYWNKAWRAGKHERLHDRFKQYGVDYVFSGHDHYYCSLTWDSVNYIQLGPSGSRYKEYRDEDRGAFQNYLLVNVSDTAVNVLVIKPGGILPRNVVTTSDIALLDTIDREALDLTVTEVAPDRPVNDSLVVKVTNVTAEVLSSRCIWSLADAGWQIEPETVMVAANPKMAKADLYRVRLPADAAPYPLPRLSLYYPYRDGKQHKIDRLLPIRRRADCLKTASPRLDGNLNDRSWKRLRPLSDFGGNDGGASPIEPAAIYLAHDDTMLYLAARCTETQIGAVKAEAGERDGRVANDDNLNFLLQPNLDSAVYYQLIVNPAGVIWDRKCWFDSGKSVKDNKWDGRWQVATGQGKDFWTLEIAVPLSEFAGYGQSWGFNICRYQARRDKVACYQAPFVHDPKQFARLTLTK